MAWNIYSSRFHLKPLMLHTSPSLHIFLFLILDSVAKTVPAQFHSFSTHGSIRDQILQNSIDSWHESTLFIFIITYFEAEQNKMMLIIYIYVPPLRYFRISSCFNFRFWLKSNWLLIGAYLLCFAMVQVPCLHSLTTPASVHFWFRSANHNCAIY